MARISAVMVLVSYGVLDCCVYVAGPWCFDGSYCASVFEAGGALFFAPAGGDHVVVFKQGVDGSDGCWPGATVGDHFCPVAYRRSTISIRWPLYSLRYASWCLLGWVSSVVACAESY